MTEQDEKPKSERKGVRSVTLSLPDQKYMELLTVVILIYIQMSIGIMSFSKTIHLIERQT